MYETSDNETSVNMEDSDGITVRKMTLKVLYTFDNENNTNFLARWPHPLHLKTAYFDNVTQLGIVELRTCIQAVVAASPDLVAKLAPDYTIYAYDFSEHGAPLVGQGMLSWVLAAPSPETDPHAAASQTLITGRVCKNSSPFARAGPGTLEVRLRLVPMNVSPVNENTKDANPNDRGNPEQRGHSKRNSHLSSDFDIERWTSFVHGNNIGSQNDEQTDDDDDRSPLAPSGIEQLQELMVESARTRAWSMSQAGDQSRAGSPSFSVPGLRSGKSSPVIGNSTASTQPLLSTSSQATRSTSKASDRTSGSTTTAAGSHTRPMTSGYESDEDAAGNNPPKRAKLVTTGWNDKPNMNIERQPNSLLMAASNAASVRVHRPRRIDSFQETASQGSIEDPVRPPTPIAKGPPPINRVTKNKNSRLRRQSSLAYSAISANPTVESNAAAPDFDNDAENRPPSTTPYQLPSSPPSMNRGYSHSSSPGFQLMSDYDSGSMSIPPDYMLDDHYDPSHFQDHNGDNDVIRKDAGEDTTPKASEKNSAIQARRETILMSDSFLPPRDNDDIEAVSTSLAPVQTAPRPRSHATSNHNRSFTPPYTRPSTRTAQSLMLATDPVPGTMPSSSEAMSDFPGRPTTPASSQRDETRTASGVRRTEQVQAKLDQCIRHGTVPPYCENCGAIETPTWRRAFCKVIEGSEAEANALKKDPIVLFWEPVDTNEDGTLASFRYYQKSLSSFDRDFTQLCLCNPCGLWLHKCKYMRPENKWNCTQDKKKGRRKSRAGLPIPPLNARPLRPAISASSPGPACPTSTNDRNDENNDDAGDKESSPVSSATDDKHNDNSNTNNRTPQQVTTGNDAQLSANSSASIEPQTQFVAVSQSQGGNSAAPSNDINNDSQLAMLFGNYNPNDAQNALKDFDQMFDLATTTNPSSAEIDINELLTLDPSLPPLLPEMDKPSNDGDSVDRLSGS